MLDGASQGLQKKLSPEDLGVMELGTSSEGDAYCLKFRHGARDIQLQFHSEDMLIDAKRQLSFILGVSMASLRLDNMNGEEVDDSMSVIDFLSASDQSELSAGACVGEAKNILSVVERDLLQNPPKWITTNSVGDQDSCLPSAFVMPTSHTCELMRQIIAEVNRALRDGVHPETCDGGSGGVYFLLSKDGEQRAVFKPLDEEARAPHNPKGYQAAMYSDGLKKGVLSGESGVREFATYMVDCRSGTHRAGVPSTCLAVALLPQFDGVPKEGSLQMFVPADDTADDWGGDVMCADDVQRIAVLDLRIGNIDRTGENLMLIKPNPFAHLTPIDHGYCLPTLDGLDSVFFVWTSWSAAARALDYKITEFIKKLDVEADISLLKRRLPQIRSESLTTLRVCTLVLQECVAAGMTLQDIARLYGAKGSQRSIIGRMVFQARRKARVEMDMHALHSLPQGADWASVEPAMMKHFKKLFFSKLKQLAPPTASAISAPGSGKALSPDQFSQADTASPGGRRRGDSSPLGL